jgi:hypothetical protein
VERRRPLSLLVEGDGSVRIARRHAQYIGLKQSRQRCKFYKLGTELSLPVTTHREANPLEIQLLERVVGGQKMGRQGSDSGMTTEKAPLDESCAM